MVLATAFAACTNEEIVENVAVDDVQGRLEFAAPAVSVGNGVESRFEWDAVAGQWKEFTANDKFSAGLMDVAKFTTLTDAPLTNYVFSSADAGETYTTTSKMKEGVYFFYSYPGFEKESERVAVPFDLTQSQKEIDLANPTANVNENQLFVSALYKVEAKNADLAVPVQFYSYWSTAGLKIKNATSQDLKIVRIVLAGAESNQFLVKGTLTPSSLGTPSVKNAELENEYIYYCEDGKYVLPYKNLKDKTKGRVDADGIRTTAMATAATDGNQGAIMVDVKNGTVAAGETTVAYIQMPAGVYAESSITAKIHVEVYDEVEEENVVKELEAEFVTNHTAAVNGVDTEFIRLRRGYAYSAFGTEPFAIDELSLNVATEGIGAYAASYEDLYQLTVKDNQYDIYNIGSLKLDDQAITLMNRLASKTSAPTITFQNPIVVTSEKKTVQSLENVVFAKGASIEKGKIALDCDAVPADQTLVVGDDAELTISVAQTGAIENHNKVTVKAASTGKITNGTDEETGNEHLTEVVIAKEGAVAVAATMAAPKTLTINEKAVVTLPSAYTNPWGKKIVNNGTIKHTDKWMNYGKVENNTKGVIEGVQNIGTYDATRTSNKLQTAEIDNYGEIKVARVFEYSLITMKSADAIVGAKVDNNAIAGTAGEIDNSIGAFVSQLEGTTVVFKKYTSNVTGNLPLVQAQNAVKLDGCTWDLTGATLDVTNLTYEFKDAVISSATTSGGVTTLNNVDFKAKLNKATGTTFNCNVNLDNTGITAAANALDLSGCTFKGTLVIDAEYAKLNGCTFDGSVTAASLKELNLYGTVNINNTFTTAVATTLTIGYGNSTDGFTASTITLNGDVTAASLTTVTVLKSAKLIVNVGNKLSAKAATAYTVNGTVSNYGKIQGNATVTLGENAKWSGDKPVASI